MARFERRISILGRSQSTFENYARHVAGISLYYGKVPTDLDPEQVHDYLFYLQKKFKSHSQTYFKHTVYGLRFLLKGEGLAYDYLRLPEIRHEKKLPVVLSKQEVWSMLQACKLLKHKVLIGLLYGCGLRCLEARNVRLQDLDFDRKQLKVVQGKGKKDRYVPLSEHLIRGLKKYIESEKPQDWIFNGQPQSGRAGGDFDSRYSQRGVQWVIKQSSKQAGILKEVHVHTLRHTFATHLLEDGLDIVSVKELLGHQNIETTMEYLHIAQLQHHKVFSPLDTLFATCSRPV
ncbi:site-specific recombinase XerD [Flavobacterium nitrogenifigens]|uniref:Site-specific recombinase XerD n=2 Tax=Flavobacterium TaxID=237 RepID=A0A7W7N9B6_9FLAO|nr:MULTISPECIES: tyrosine-type recombinase/integrase [Flavobacterium]MBB4803326.1 site-specific recombinase XerD [Flavobacterium nitrogenifigens]MBB6388284.1 site-specific recombinase XerD [Flavobacterium notoginsengisoli]